MAQGYGTTIAFDSGFLASITSFSRSMERPVIDMSDTTSPDGWMEKEPGDLKNPGTLVVQINYDPSADPPIDEPVESITITYSDGSTEVCDGFLSKIEHECPHDNKITGTATIEYSGAPVLTPG